MFHRVVFFRMKDEINEDENECKNIHCVQYHRHVWVELKLSVYMHTKEKIDR